MGATQSWMVISQDPNIYQNQECLESSSSDMYKDILKFYKISSLILSSQGVTGDILYEKEHGGIDWTVYVVILFNPNNDKECFCLLHTNSKAEGEQRFQQFRDICIPFVDVFPSVFSTEKLTAFIKLREENPTWSIHKVAEHMQLPEVKVWRNQENQYEFLELIKEKQPAFFSDLFGSTPLQYLTERHPDLVETCMSTASNLHQTGKETLININKYTETPIHVAIRLSQEGLLRMLLDKGANPSVMFGHAYPIHLALQNDTIACVRVLLEYDADSLTYRDTKYNGSVLHWAKSSEAVDFLVNEHHLDVDARSCEGETPLHVMVKRKRLSAVIALVSNGADIDAIAEDGSTALHYSILQDDVDIVKVLLILGADATIKNKDGRTALESADDHADTHSALVELFELFHYRESKHPFDTSRTGSILKEKTGAETLLSLDGGGIRGLILTQILLALEAASGQPVHNLFDWVCGTSTGSYLAISSAVGKSVRACQYVYFRLGKICFQGVRPYPTETMDKFLIDEFGVDTTMDKIEFPKVMIPAVMGDRRPAMLHLFRNYESPYDEQYQMRDARFPRPPLPADQLIWLATRSSCSAPSYFRSTGRYLDGGLIANNPTLDVLSEIHKHEKHFQTAKSRGKTTNLKTVVSIGTGRQSLQVLRTIDIYRPSSVWDTPEIVDNLRGFVDLMIDQVSASDDHVVDRARSWCEMVDVDYFRFNPTLTKFVELNETDERNLINMLVEVQKYIDVNYDSIVRLSKVLLGEENM